MNFILILIFLFLIFSFFFFISKSLSPIPFYPTNKKDLPLIVKTIFQPFDFAQGRLSTCIFDLGAGTGTVIFAAASVRNGLKPFPTFIAVEINPVLILILHLRRSFHPNKKNIKIVWSDLFKLNLREFLTFNCQLLTVYIYVGPFVMERLKPKLLEFPKKTMIVSYMYQIPGWEKKHLETKKGVKKIYIYRL